MKLTKNLQGMLASSFVFVVGRAIILPYLALFMTQKFSLNQQQLGWILGCSLTVASLCGVYAGYLADRFNKSGILRLACYLMALSSLVFSLANYLILVVLSLIVIEVAIVSRSIALKAALAEMVDETQRGKLFSINYTLINLAFSLGPVFGALVYKVENLAPFWLSAALALSASALIPRQALPASSTSTPRTGGFKQNWQVLRQDRRLLWFTLASICSAFVFGRFISGYLAQYLLTQGGVAYAAELIPAILVTNAVVVTATQYLVGTWLKPGRLLAWVSLGLLFYIAGLVGFMQAQTVSAWICATLIFTLGEVIVIPCEYLFIDSIAPAAQRGSYYGVQSLSSFGVALNPVLCGYLLAHFASALIFYVLIGFAFLAMLFFYLGARSSLSRSPELLMQSSS